MRFNSIRALLERTPSRRSNNRFPAAAGSSPSRLAEQRIAGPNPGALEMFAYMPPNLAPGVPLVVILHGCGQTAASYDAGAGWTTLAEELGFAVLAPQQVTANNPNTCFNWFEPGDTARDHGEAASIYAMIEHFVREYGIDPARVFITGLSAGGAMTAAMLSAYPEVFAGGAILAGLAAGSASNIPEAFRGMRHAPNKSPQEWGDLVRHASAHRGRWPTVSIWHGAADQIVHPGNGEALAMQWSDVHGLTSSAEVQTQGENFHRRVWSGKNGTPQVELISVADMGHGVPVGDASADPYGQQGPNFPNVGISSTARIASFWGFTVPAAVPAADGRFGKLASSPDGFRHPFGVRANVRSGGKSGAHSVIVKSLRAAGLIKD